MKQKNHTQKERLRRLEQVATNLYVKVATLERAVKVLQDENEKQLKQ